MPSSPESSRAAAVPSVRHGVEWFTASGRLIVPKKLSLRFLKVKPRVSCAGASAYSTALVATSNTGKATGVAMHSSSFVSRTREFSAQTTFAAYDIASGGGVTGLSSVPPVIASVAPPVRMIFENTGEEALNGTVPSPLIVIA